jgi:hypothetical protein
MLKICCELQVMRFEQYVTIITLSKAEGSNPKLFVNFHQGGLV